MTILAVVLLALSASAQGTLTTLFTNGPATNRVNVVVLSEGYTTNQSGQFLVDATNLVNRLLAAPPFSEYRDYFNACAISVASHQSGSDHPTYPAYVNTYFNSTYDTNSNYFITIPPNWASSNPANGQAKVDALVTNLVPQADLVMLLVNDFTPGGSSGLYIPGVSGTRQPVVSSRYSFPPESDIPVHEAGHYFAGLVDEYAYLGADLVTIEAPNSTRQTSRASIRWNAWIDAATPIPTPNTQTYAGVVGLFQGAQYQPTGWYRPKLDCKMRTPGVPFCEVCSEQIVKMIYQAVRPLDSLSPSASNITTLSSQPVWFTVNSPQPETHALNAQWYTNNVAVPGATNLAFALTPSSVGNGTHTVRTIVWDDTTLVRNATVKPLLRATNTWALTVSLNELRLTSPLFLADGRFRLTVTGAAPQGFVIQASTNFNHWVKLSTNTLVGGKYNFTNSGLGGIPFRYYRTVSPP